MKVAFVPAQTDSSIKIILLIGYLVLTFIISAAIENIIPPRLTATFERFY